MLLCAEHILPITQKPIHQGAILVRDGYIRDVGMADMLKLRYPDEEVIDYGLAALMPGLVDLHTHLEYSAMRGVVHDVPYVTWNNSIVEKSTKMDANDWYDSAILGGLEALSNGITCVADITSTGAACSATQRLGMRGVVYRRVGAADKRRVDFAMRVAENDIMHWREEVDPDRITIGIAPVAMYLCHPSVYKRIAEFSRRENAPLAMHLAGTREEYNFIKYGSSMFSVDAMDYSNRGFVEVPPWLPTGTTPVRYALNWGAFECDNVMAIHCVHVDEIDIQKLREYNVSVAVCPRCNAQLGMGVAPVNEFLQAGLRLGIGTDSPAATDTTDMLTEMRIGMLVQRAVNLDAFLDSTTMLEMATIGGARALKLDHKIGSLEVGKCADIVAVDLSSSQQISSSDPISAIVNTCDGADVIMTMVNGETLYEKNNWNVDVEIAGNIARVLAVRGKLKA